MKCLQKDSAKRYQSVEAFEIALVKASKARTVSPWEIAVNRALDRAEVEIRKRTRHGFEAAQAFLKRQDWSALTNLQKEPLAMLGIAGLAGALTVSLFVLGFKSRTINAQASEIPAQSSSLRLAPVGGPAAAPVAPSVQEPPNPISSREVDLYKGQKTSNVKEIMPAPTPADEVSRPEPAAHPAISAKPSAIAKRVKASGSITSADNSQTKTQQGPAQSQLPATPAQSESVTIANSSDVTLPEPVASSPEPGDATAPTIGDANSAVPSKVSSAEPKAPGKVYFEVGTFKDEAWANNAVDKLNQLGFHAVLIHKNRLWLQSYHVEVGPYTDQKAIAEAQQSLTSQGYKPHPVN